MTDDEIMSAAKRIECKRVEKFKVHTLDAATSFEIRWYCDNRPYGTTSHHITVPADAVKGIAADYIRAAADTEANT